MAGTDKRWHCPALSVRCATSTPLSEHLANYLAAAEETELICDARAKNCLQAIQKLLTELKLPGPVCITVGKKRAAHPFHSRCQSRAEHLSAHRERLGSASRGTELTGAREAVALHPKLSEKTQKKAKLSLRALWLLSFNQKYILWRSPCALFTCVFLSFIKVMSKKKKKAILNKSFN